MGMGTVGAAAMADTEEALEATEEDLGVTEEDLGAMEEDSGVTEQEEVGIDTLLLSCSFIGLLHVDMFTA